jgi:hypothetical protein
VDGTGSGPCPVGALVVSSVSEPSGSSVSVSSFNCVAKYVRILVKVQPTLAIRNRLGFSDAEFRFRQNCLVRPSALSCWLWRHRMLKNQQLANTSEYFCRPAVASGCAMRFTSLRFHCRNIYFFGAASVLRTRNRKWKTP